MIEIKIKRYENGEKTSDINKDVEVTELYNFMYNEMKDFLKKSKTISYKESYYNLHCGKRDLLISFDHTVFHPRKWWFVYNGIGYSYQRRLQGLKEGVTMFINFVNQDAKHKSN